MELWEVYCRIKAFSLMLRPILQIRAKQAYEQYMVSLDEEIKKTKLKLTNLEKVKQNLRKEMTDAQIKFNNKL